MVPSVLKLDKNNIWVNDKPNSINFTRPVYFIYEKESPGLIINTSSNIEERLNQNQNFSIFLAVNEYKARHKIQLDYGRRQGY